MRVVAYGSAESVVALESADLVVGTTDIEIEWTKRPDATYLQAWHGTPLRPSSRPTPAMASRAWRAWRSVQPRCSRMNVTSP